MTNPTIPQIQAQLERAIKDGQLELAARLRCQLWRLVNGPYRYVRGVRKVRR